MASHYADSKIDNAFQEHHEKIVIPTGSMYWRMARRNVAIAGCWGNEIGRQAVAAGVYRCGCFCGRQVSWNQVVSKPVTEANSGVVASELMNPTSLIVTVRF
jgi:hypothetical protein